MYLKRGYGSGRTSLTQARTRERVNVRSLDSVVDELRFSPSVIKIDTEGYEMKVLKGAESTLMTCKPRLIIASYHYQDKWKEIARYLTGLGFRCFAYSVPLTLQRTRESYVYAEPSSS